MIASRSALNDIRSSGREQRRCRDFAAPNFSRRHDGFVIDGELGMCPGSRSCGRYHPRIAFEAPL
jgi:hypothetical protein